jgi:uncharacterized protein YjbI with pentapeptide repeats
VLDHLTVVGQYGMERYGNLDERLLTQPQARWWTNLADIQPSAVDRFLTRSRQNGAGHHQEAAMAARKKLAARALWKMRRPSRPAPRAAIAASEKPATWAQWKARHPRWTRLTGVEWALEWLVYRCRNLAIFEVLEFAGRASVLIALIVWFSEAGDREKQKHYRAWELINSARGSTGDGGRRDALQDLNEDGEPLIAAPLAKAYLLEVKLSKAKLNQADLSETNLSEANLSGADLRAANLSRADLPGADLSGADLRAANLSRADLSRANLSGADLSWAGQSRNDHLLKRGSLLRIEVTNLSEANLSGANLFGANLAGADLSGADLRVANLSWANLSEVHLHGANLAGAKLKLTMFCRTIMPDGTVNNRDCPPEPESTQPAPPSPGEETSAPE